MNGGAPEGDIVLKLLHTADWHLGRRFRTFSEENEKKLTRARLDVLDRILNVAERHVVDAVLCAGDLFDEPSPSAEWWEQLAARLTKRNWGSRRPVFLLPGNHDPLLNESVWAKNHPFRALLPDWVHVVDHERFEYALSPDAVLYAVPCLSKAGQGDPTLAIPERAAGDARIRVGMVHGSTFDIKDCQTNFPIDVDATIKRGLDYLAIGDTHGFRYVPSDRKHPPTIYPGAPEPTAFDEVDPGSVAVVFMNRHRRASVTAERVAQWTWEAHTITSLEQLSALAERTDMRARVVRLIVSMTLSAPDHERALALLEALEGTEARHGKIGVLDLDHRGLRLDASTIDTFCTDLPDVLQSTVRRLKALVDDNIQGQAAERALVHLYRASRKKAS